MAQASNPAPLHSLEICCLECLRKEDEKLKELAYLNRFMKRSVENGMETIHERIEKSDDFAEIEKLDGQLAILEKKLNNINQTIAIILSRRSWIECYYGDEL